MTTRAIVGSMLLLGLLVGTGCAGTRTSARDVQVLEAASKAEAIQNQRAILELRGEIQQLQKELGVARAAQARLEGELREAQRSVAEAQRQVNAQREDLVKAREERDKAVQAGREAQGQLIELGKLRQQVADTEREQTRVQALETAVEQQAKDLAELKAAAKKATVGINSTRRNSKSINSAPTGTLQPAVSAGGPAKELILPDNSPQ